MLQAGAGAGPALPVRGGVFPVIALFLAYKLGFQADLSALDRMSAPAVLGLFALVPLAALLGMGISYLVSCRIVADKEF